MRKKDAAVHKNKPSLFDATYRPSTSPAVSLLAEQAHSPHAPHAPLGMSSRSPRGLRPETQGGTSLPVTGGSAPSSMGERARRHASQVMPLPMVSSGSQSQSSARAHAGSDMSTGTVADRSAGEGHGANSKAAAESLSHSLRRPGDEESAKRSNNKNEPESTIDVVVLAKKHGLSLDEVRKLWEEFRCMDIKSKGYLSMEEFEQVVRKKCNLAVEEEIPPYLLEEQCRKIGISSWIKFEAYLSWAVATAFAEEIMVPDPAQRHLRKLARHHGVPYDDIERVKAVYDNFDSDKSGCIDVNEFRQVLTCLMMQGPKATEPSNNTVKRYFKEVDTDGSGEVEFEEFLGWFLIHF